MLLSLALEEEYDEVDILTVWLLYKKLEKIVDNMYAEIIEIIEKELIESINRNANLLYNIIEIDKTFNKATVNSILKNEHTNHTVTFELNKNKRRLKNNIKTQLTKAIKDGSSLDDINKQIKKLVYNKVYGKTKGDGAKTLRTFRTEYTRTRTKAKLLAIEDLKNQGYNVIRSWLYTFESKVPRPGHLASDGIFEDENGYFMIDGYKTKGPGLFGVASEDINCRCDTECYVTNKWTVQQ